MRRMVPAACAVLLSSIACSGGGAGGGETPQPATVEESLARLGIDTAATPRVADKATQAPLPESYSPFGAAQTFNKLDELAFFGARLTGFAFDSIVTIVEAQQSVSNPGTFTVEALHTPSAASTPWAASSGATPAALRAAAAGDLDADGLEEVLVASYAAGDAAVVLRTIQDRVARFASATPVDVSAAAPTGLAVASGDFDGDGTGDAVVAVSTTANVQLVFLKGGTGGLALTGATLTLSPVTASTSFEVVLAAGNLDADPAHELAVVMNERTQSGGTDSGTARYWIYDDATTSLAARRQAQRVTASAGGVSRTALVASVAIGDVDGDNVGEVVLGGLTALDPGGTCAYAYLLLALDGLDADLASLGASYHATLFPASSTCTALRLRTLHLLTLDRDGDGADEVQANQLAFEDFRAAAPWTPLPPDLPLHELLGGSGGTYSGEFSRATSAFAAGDLTGDKKSDLFVYSQFGEPTTAPPAPPGTLPPAVRVHATSVDPDTGAELWRETISITTPAPPAEPFWPILVAANVDHDSMSIQFSPAERRVVFTEPVIIAALAAAPCSRDLGQDLGNCRTSFGTADTATVEEETAWTVTAGAMVGAKFEAKLFGVGFETEVGLTVKGYLSGKTLRSYELTKRVVRTTGPLEDGVIFTSIPYDQFVYTITSHPNPVLIGKQIVVSLPRSPIETLVERSFFNASVPAGSVQIDDAVFRHVPGQPRSYPTALERDALIAARPELFNGPFDVGQGGGLTTAEISLGETLGGGLEFGVEAELEVKATVGQVMGGFTVGRGASAALRINHGTETYYAGQVANIAADRYSPGVAYGFGLMAYLHDDPKQPFEVVNYWVE